jgi:hypothetical protein
MPRSITSYFTIKNSLRPKGIISLIVLALLIWLRWHYDDNMSLTHANLAIKPPTTANRIRKFDYQVIQSDASTTNFPALSPNSSNTSAPMAPSSKKPFTPKILPGKTKSRGSSLSGL